MIDDLEKMLKIAATDVFATMLSFKVEISALNGQIADGRLEIAGAVGITGSIDGIVYLYSTEAFGRQMTATLLGLSLADVEGEEMVNDAIGELTNMLAGNIKSRLCDHGKPCCISIPAVVRGRSLKIGSVSGAESRALFVKCRPTDGVLVEILIKPK